MPTDSRIGVMVPWLIVSPTPASGPIRPVFTPLMASSSISAPFARCSSMAITAPWMTPPTFGSVLKKVHSQNARWTSDRSSLISGFPIISGPISGLLLQHRRPHERDVEERQCGADDADGHDVQASGSGHRQDVADEEVGDHRATEDEPHVHRDTDGRKYAAGDLKSLEEPRQVALEPVDCVSHHRRARVDRDRRREEADDEQEDLGW